MPPDGPNGRKGFGMGLGGYVLIDPAQSENLGIAGEYNGAGVAGTYYWIDRANNLAGLWFTQRSPQTQSELHRFKVLTYQALVQ
jgi:CubicO group peptidase (beta-lactamase class C family)